MDVVLTKCTKNEEKTPLRRLLVWGYYTVLNRLSDVPIPSATPDFRLIGRRYIDILRSMQERERMFRGLLNWLGTKNMEVIEFTAPARTWGKSHYNMRASLKLAFDSILQFSTKPLRLAIYLGIFAALLACGLGAWTIVEYFMLDRPATGYTTIISIVVFASAIQMILLGIIGEYVGRIHMEVKRRPLYFAKFISREEWHAGGRKE